MRTPRSMGRAFLVAGLAGFPAACVPFQQAPVALSPANDREMSIGAGVSQLREDGQAPRTSFAAHGGMQFQRRWKDSPLRLDAGGTLSGDTAVPSAALGAFGRAGLEGDWFYAGLQADLGLIYGGLGPVIALGHEPIWFYGAARAFFVPLGDDPLFLLFPQVAAGVSYSLSDSFALGVGGDWVNFTYDQGGGWLSFSGEGRFYRAELVFAYRCCARGN